MNRSLHIYSIVLVALCLILLSPNPARADIQTIRDADNAAWISGGGSLFKYKEPIDPPNLPDSERKWLPSGALGGSFLTPQNNIYVSAEGSLTRGDADYKGAYLFSPTTPLKSTTLETIFEADGKIGQGFALGSSMMFIPYAELGFRHWERNLGRGQVEDYQNSDILGGLMIQISPFEKWVLSGYGSAGSTFASQMKADPDKFQLGNAGMYKMGGKLGYELTKKTQIFTSYEYDYFRYLQSAVSSRGFYEPTSDTEETAIRVGLAYHFD
jgi:hypothetical protein